MGEFLKIAISALAGLVSGAVGSLIAPWVNWGIEKQKSRLLERRKLIGEVRQELKAAPDKREFRETDIYARIRPHLKERTRNIIEWDSVVVQKSGRGSGNDNYKSRVLDDMHSLENRWRLI